MAFMEQQITDKVGWYEVDGFQGTEWIDSGLVGDLDEFDSDTLQPVPDKLADYCTNSHVFYLKKVYGHGARLSAPGYTDCTDWVVFDTEREAEEYLEDLTTYGD